MRKIFIILLLFSFVGCSTLQKYKRPAIPLPDNITYKREKKVSLKFWWKKFNDRKLSKLIDIALKNNDDLKLATERVEEAAAYLGFSIANRAPLISATGSFSRFQTSKEATSYKASISDNKFILSSSISYELDFWGKLKNQEKYSRAMLLSEKYNQQIVRISVIADVAINYIKLAACEAQIKIANETLKNYFDIYNFREKQYKNGLIDELTLNQAKSLYESAKILIEQIKSEKKVLISTLSILIGETPKELFSNNLKTNFSFIVNIDLPQFLPSKLLENRPDIRKAEEILKATNFNVAVARAEFFPNFSLTALLGLESRKLRNLIDINAKNWNIGGDIAQTLFDFGRRESDVKVALAKRKEALINYIKTVKTAFKDVYNALNKIKFSENKIKAEQENIKTLKTILKLAKKKYKIGTVDYLNVLVANEDLLSAKLELVNFQAELLINKINFFKAIGF